MGSHPGVLVGIMQAAVIKLREQPSGILPVIGHDRPDLLFSSWSYLPCQWSSLQDDAGLSTQPYQQPGRLRLLCGCSSLACLQVWWSQLVATAFHFVMGLILYLRARQTDLDDSSSIAASYMFVWKLFYAEYLFIPFLR